MMSSQVPFLINRFDKLLLIRNKINISNYLLLALSISFSLVVAEVLLRFFYRPPQVISGWKALVRNTNELNQLGFRGQPIQYGTGDFVVVLLGDSQVEAEACPYPEMPEKRLQYYLNACFEVDSKIKVFSIGAGGYGQDQQLLALAEYYQSYHADLVILWQTPQNDVWNNIFPTHWPKNGTPKPTFWLVDHKLCGPSEGIGQSITSSIRLLALWKSRFSNTNRDDFWEAKYLRQHTPYIPLVQAQGVIIDDWQKRWDQNVGKMRQEDLDTEKSHLAMSLTPRSQRMLYGLELTKRLTQEIDRLVYRNDGKFIVFNTESYPKSGSKPEEQVHRLNGRYYKTSRAQYERNLDFINKDFEFYNVPVTVKDRAVSATNRHLNARANDQVMGDLADKLKPLLYEIALKRNNRR